MDPSRRLALYSAPGYKLTSRQCRRAWHKEMRAQNDYEPVDLRTRPAERPKGRPTPRQRNQVEARHGRGPKLLPPLRPGNSIRHFTPIVREELVNQNPPGPELTRKIQTPKPGALAKARGVLGFPGRAVQTIRRKVTRAA
jgi:hypothetical protein